MVVIRTAATKDRRNRALTIIKASIKKTIGTTLRATTIMIMITSQSLQLQVVSLEVVAKAAGTTTLTTLGKVAEVAALVVILVILGKEVRARERTTRAATKAPETKEVAAVEVAETKEEAETEEMIGLHLDDCAQLLDWLWPRCSGYELPL